MPIRRWPVAGLAPLANAGGVQGRPGRTHAPVADTPPPLRPDAPTTPTGPGPGRCYACAQEDTPLAPLGTA